MERKEIHITFSFSSDTDSISLILLAVIDIATRLWA
jgi:hypothetical protein